MQSFKTPQNKAIHYKMYDHEYILREMREIAHHHYSGHFRKNHETARINILTGSQELYLHMDRGRIKFGSEGIGTSSRAEKKDLPIEEAARVISARNIVDQKTLVENFAKSVEANNLDHSIPRLINLKKALKIE